MVSVVWASSSSACGAFSPAPISTTWRADLVARGQHGRAINEVARHIPAGKRDAHDHAVAVRHDFWRCRAHSALPSVPATLDMRVDIGGDRICGCRDLRRIGEILLRVENLRAGEAVGIAALERHLRRRRAVRPQLDARGREIDLVRMRRAASQIATKQTENRQSGATSSSTDRPSLESGDPDADSRLRGNERKPAHDPAPTALSNR